MAASIDLTLTDLPPRKDPKGGSPRTPPRGIPYREYQQNVDDIPSDGTALWRLIAVSLISVNITLVGAIWVLGTNNVKWSDIDDILAKRAPYNLQKERIWDNFDHLKETDEKAAAERGKLTARLENIEKLYYQDHANNRSREQLSQEQP